MPAHDQLHGVTPGRTIRVHHTRRRSVGRHPIPKIPKPIRNRTTRSVGERHRQGNRPIGQVGTEVGYCWNRHNQVHEAVGTNVHQINQVRIRHCANRQNGRTPVGGQSPAVGEKRIRAVREATRVGNIKRAIQDQVADHYRQIAIRSQFVL